MDARISIIIPVYNSRFLAEAVRSVLAAQVPKEVLVIDDGSTDGCTNFLEGHPNVRLIRTENQGPATARNLGRKHSTGELIYFFDSDDRLIPGALESLWSYLENHPQENAVSGQLGPLIDEQGNWLGNFETVFNRPPFPRLTRLEKEHLRPPRAFSPNLWLLLFRRNLLNQIGEFEISLKSAEDLDFLYRALAQTSIPVVSQPIVEYRIHASNLSCRRENEQGLINPRNRAETFLIDWSHR